MTETELSTSEANAALGRLLGWVETHDPDRCDGTMRIRCGACGRMGHSNCYGDGRGQLHFKCADMPCCPPAVPPDYCSDLNVIAEAEQKLTNEQHAEYRQAVADIIRESESRNFSRSYFSATAEERARAMLSVLSHR